MTKASRRRRGGISAPPHTDRKAPPSAPLYQARIRYHLPAEAGWREMAYQPPQSIIIGPKAESFFQNVIRSLLTTLTSSFAAQEDRNSVAFGFLLNLIQQFPLEFRQAFAAAIISGHVLTLMEEDGALTADLSQEVDALDLDTGARRTASGIILPGNV